MSTASNDGRPAEDLLLPGEDQGSSRRAFLQLAGFGIASATLTGCSRGPLQKAIPHLIAQEGILPGRAYWMATTCHGCASACGVLARCRDGRPIKLEGSPEHALSQGGLCAVGQSSVLGLYDSTRNAGPSEGSEARSWKQATDSVRGLIDQAKTSGGKLRLLTGTVHSPSTKAMIDRFMAATPGAQHITYDPLSVSGIMAAHAKTHGQRILPRYRFENAKVIASFGADFLGSWIAPVEFALGWARGRILEGATQDQDMSLHVQLEGTLSLSGTAADRRERLAPAEQGVALESLCRILEGKAGASSRFTGQLAEFHSQPAIEKLAGELWNAKGAALVVSGSNDVALQVLVNYANELLGSYGSTVDISRPSQQRSGDDGALDGLIRELQAGEVSVLIVSGVNPLYDLPAQAAAAISKAGTMVSLADLPDETSAASQWVLPVPHWLESWDDGEPVVGHFSLTQPTMAALRNGRTLRQTLAGLMGDGRDDRELLEDYWRKEVFPRQSSMTGFRAFFEKALHDGYMEIAPAASAAPNFQSAAVAAAPAALALAAGELQLMLYPTVGMQDGAHAHNPWLQEMPDPLTRLTWDNYACLSPKRAEELNLQDGDVVRLNAGGDLPELELPIQIQRGQHDDVVAVPLGYGRAGTDRFSKVGPQWFEAEETVEEGGTIGVNGAPLLSLAGGELRADRQTVSLTATGRRDEGADLQDYDSLVIPADLAPHGHERRDAVRLATFKDWKENPEGVLGHSHHASEDLDLFPPDHENDGPHWGMAVDLSRCTGCSACVVSCSAENNVPVVGKHEVRLHREMHWIRIDRYFEGDDDDLRTAFQPMMCQHCDNAPCEAVCPVLATVHSSDGMNQQVYNRCVGTRYCANTCPYKVRRFNWFDYPHEDHLQNHSLNPDVTVRSRGVMEKCSLCVQRIQEARGVAASKGIELKDGDIQLACQQSCPTRAIEFGDVNDPDSRVSRLVSSPRGYRVLEELNVKPGVTYLARIENREPGENDHAH